MESRKRQKLADNAKVTCSPQTMRRFPYGHHPSRIMGHRSPAGARPVGFSRPARPSTVVDLPQIQRVRGSFYPCRWLPGGHFGLFQAFAGTFVCARSPPLQSTQDGAVRVTSPPLTGPILPDKRRFAFACGRFQQVLL